MIPFSVMAMSAGMSMLAAMASALALDGATYPDWRGRWVRMDGGRGPQFDPSKPPGRGQQVPLNAKYQAIFDANLKNLATGTQPYPQLGCLPPDMPCTMILYEPVELIITPVTTNMAFSFMNDPRRVYTDGRDWRPASSRPSWADPSADGSIRRGPALCRSPAVRELRQA